MPLQPLTHSDKDIKHFYNKQFDYLLSEKGISPLNFSKKYDSDFNLSQQQAEEEPSASVNDPANRYAYLTELVKELRKMKQMELFHVAKKFDFIEQQMVEGFLGLEIVNDKIEMETKKNLKIIQECKAARKILELAQQY